MFMEETIQFEPPYWYKAGRNIIILVIVLYILRGYAKKRRQEQRERMRNRERYPGQPVDIKVGITFPALMAYLANAVHWIRKTHKW